MKQKQNLTPPNVHSGRIGSRQRSRWLGLLVMIVMTLAALPAKAGYDNNTQPLSWARDMDITPDLGDSNQPTKNEWMTFEVSHINWDGDNFWWQKFDLIVDGVNIGSISSIGCPLKGRKYDDVVWSGRAGWMGGYYVKTTNHRQDGNKWKYTYIHVFFPQNTYGQTHTIEVDGIWVSKNGSTKSYYGPNQSRHIKYTSNPVTFNTTGCGTYERTAPGQITWKPSKSVTASSGYSHKYEFRLNDTGNWITNSNPNGNYVLTDINNNEAQAYHTRYVQYKTYTQANRTIDVTFTRDWQKTQSGNIVQACTQPTDLNVEPNLWNKTVTVSWNKEYTDRLQNGKFYIYRYTNGDIDTREKLGVVNFNDRLAFTDDNVEYDTEYTYQVSFILDNWDNTSPVEDLTLTKTISTSRDEMFPIELSAVPSDNDITLNWSFPNPQVASGASFKVYRRGVNETNWSELTSIGTVTASKNDDHLSVSDNTIASSCESYYYEVRTELAERMFTATLERPVNLTGDGTQITSLTCNRGTYSNMVKVQWRVEQVGTSATHYVLYRRLIGEGDDTYKSIYECDGTSSSYYYEDVTVQPGQYYMYYVEGSTECSSGATLTTYSDSRDGFAQSKGVLSGRVSYGTGTAVEGAKVRLTTDSDAGKAQFYSLYVGGLGNRIEWTDATELPKVLAAGKAFSVQFWMKADAVNQNEATNSAIVMDLGGSQRLEYRPDGKLYAVAGGTVMGSSAITLTPNRFYNVSYRYDGNGHVSVGIVDGTKVSSFGYDATLSMAENRLTFGAPSGATTEQQFYGNFDDIRLWSSCLTDKEILANYQRLLSGQETALAAYWPVDEGVNALKMVYDYSKQGGVANERHAQMTNGVLFSTTVPEADQLSLYGVTDSQGNYVVRGIPYSGDGTNYSVTPVMDSHEFSPQYQSRYVSSSALNHSGVDFTDISSFLVEGVIRYAGTNIPVDSVQISVDGRVASRNNEIVVTDENGRFVVDVPIGRHYISASKDGHTFVKEGRIPADPTGLNETTYEFVKPESGFLFWDNTLVTVAGRVVGGAIEGEKPLGFADTDDYRSKNTIGQARITLEIPDTRYMLNASEGSEGLVNQGFQPVATNTPLTYPAGATATGEGYRTGGDEMNKAQQVVITTDAATGDFAVLLPPLDYRVVSVQMVNTQSDDAYKFPSDQLPRIDASRPATVLQDSIPTEDGGYRYFDYVASLKLTKHTDPVLSVRQLKKNKHDVLPAGVFGDAEASYSFINAQGKEETQDVALYTVDDQGHVTYNYGYPIFGTQGKYHFKLEAYETYINYEKAADDRVTRVPLQNMVVTISNAMSASQSVYPEGHEQAGQVADLKENELQLDDKGEAVYSWEAGLPNPKGDFTRRLNMTYNNGVGDYSWQGLDGIIFGDLPTGTNFTTKGPQNVQMVLHDPYGDSSFATWESGKVTTTTKETLKTSSSESSFSGNIHLGPKIEVEEGILISVQTEIEVVADIESGHTRTEQHDTVDVNTTTIETTRAISTSADPDMVGADADIYIGESENLLFGGSLRVGLKGDSINAPQIVAEDAVVVSTQFDTEFFYTQYEIETKIIPDLLRLRNLALTYNANPAAVSENEGDDPLYLTALQTDDPHYGEDGTYKYLPGKKGSIDMVHYYNESVKNWQEQIKASEKHKLNLFADQTNREKKNLSFGGGVELTESEAKSTIVSNTTTHSYTFVCNLGTDFGATFNGVGLDLAYESHNTPAYPTEDEKNGAETDGTETEETATFSYTLSDSGADDMFSMDIYKAVNNHGPVFRTRGGQSSCPYEGQEVTKYYQPGEELSAATVQIEQPFIDCKNRLLTGVPTGGKAQFELELWNNSGIKADAYFELVPVDGTNPLGAKLSLPTGAIGNGRTIFVPYSDEPLKMILTLEQGNLDVTDYENIELELRSTCQNDETSIHGAIKSTVSLSAHFVPASTPVELAIDRTVVNIGNVDEDLTLRVTGFDRNFQGLQRVDIQYKAPGATMWSLLKGYIPSNDVRTDNNQVLLPDNGVIELAVSMKSTSWTDGTYQFRAQSAATYAGRPVTSESYVLTVVKDVHQPMLLGLANPSDGVLNSGDEISITFNEDIQQGMLTDNNFVVSGVLNGDEIAHDVALSAQNTEQAAYTEAGINLAQKDFAADLWVRVTNGGDILTHGNGAEKFRLSIDAAGHLVVGIGSESYTSAKTIAKNTWTFLAVSYDYESGSSRLSARAVTANTTDDLFTDELVADYSGTGSLTLGQHFTGALHELTLWDTARMVDEAQAEMHHTKKPSTPHLIGYWKMDEGSGTQATDYARNRHLTLPATTWYLNNDNKAVALDGTNALKLDITACSPLATEDYAVELWFKGNKADQTAATSLLYAGEQSVGLGFSTAGLLTLSANGSDIEVSKNDYLDNAWHHLALNVLRNGSATVYVDGQPLKSLSASAVPALAGNYLYIGSRGTEQQFKGAVDEIRLWRASMTGSLLGSQRTQRLTGTESGLAAYYPFEQMSRDAQTGIISSVGSATDVTGSGMEAQISTLNSQLSTFNFIDEAPALKVKPEATNVRYSYVANERSIVITLGEHADRLEGTTINFAVRGVNDLNGNESEVINWTAYVKQNQLLWKDETEVSVEKQVGQTATFEAVIVNESGSSENWTLSGLPSWLTASATSGTLKAQLQKAITFTVAESLPIGKYEQTIYLTGNNNISEPLTINVKVKGEEPLWAVSEGDFEETMNIVGSLVIDGVVSQDEDDIVAAFVGNECRGVANPIYLSKYDAYYVMMSVYGNAGDSNTDLAFKVFDASTGTTYPLVATSQAVKFNPDQMTGSFASPVVFTPQDAIEQTLALKKGWTWTSVYVTPMDNTLDAIFRNNNGEVTYVKNKSAFAQLSGEEFKGSLTGMTVGDMYKVNAATATTTSLIGAPAVPTAVEMAIAPGWNWIGYNSASHNSLANAFADLDPQDGDIVKSQGPFSIYDGGEWIGSLEVVTPGQGYCYWSEAAQAKTFHYPTPAAMARQQAKAAEAPQFVNSDYEGNMSVVAIVKNGDQVLSGAQVTVVSGGEVRGYSARAVRNGMHFVSVAGKDSGDELLFMVTSDGFDYTVPITEHYQNDAVLGSLRAPYVLDIAGTTGIQHVEASGVEAIYDLTGRKLQQAQRKGVYIVNGKKNVIK